MTGFLRWSGRCLVTLLFFSLQSVTDVAVAESDVYHARVEAGSRKEYRIANPAQGFDGRLDGRRLVLQGETWEWGLALNRWGRPGALGQVAEGRLTADGGRVESERGARLTEWIENNPAGLEHGFLVMEPPEEDAESDLLVFEIAISGGLRPVFASDGQAVDFYDTGSISVLRYAKLEVTDATGRRVTAWMEPIIGGLRIAVRDTDTVYPLTVDPLTTTAAWTAEGDQQNERFGASVATAGDVNGDGYADVIVGAPNHDNGEGVVGQALLFLGSAAGVSSTPAWTAEGDQAGALFGGSVATAGDVNGDGYADVLVGAFLHDDGEINEGKALLFLGSPTGLSSTPAWTAEGNQEAARFGGAVATAGDVNGDGYADVIIGAAGYDNGQTDEGRAFLYLGSASGLSSTPGWTAESDSLLAYFGGSVATAGDVNGDGYADVIVGAENYGNAQGRAYAYLGSATGLSSDPAWIADTIQSTAAFGGSVATAGDVNGDGYSDVIVGTYQNNANTAFVYLGSATGLALTPAWYQTSSVPSTFGRVVATAGDVNGDGYSDIIIGAPQHTNGETEEGAAYVYLGSASGLSGLFAWRAEGNQSHAIFGSTVATAGDVNGDGYSDIIVGASRYDNAQTDAGKAYVYLGSANGLASVFGWSTESNQAGARLGNAVAPAGDVNGDGYSDIVVGAYAFDNGQNDEGLALVYRGSETGLTTTPAWTAEGDQAGAFLGLSVSTAGDVNADGYADVVIGAPYFDHGQPDEGRAYMYLGSPAGLPATPTWFAESDQSGAAFGSSLASAGDVNGDGYADVIVGAPYYDDGEIIGGRVFLYLGSVVGLSSSPAWTAQGDQPGALFGDSVASAGDVNGDGYADVVVGAPFYDNGSASEGRVSVFLGSAAGLSPTPAWVVEGGQNAARFGSSVATAGDVNGDGYSDVLVGAYLFDNGELDEGRAFLYLGSAAGLSTTPAWTADGDQAGASYGIAVATAGDVNDDGYSDIIIGSSSYSYYSKPNAGRAIVYLGSAAGPSTMTTLSPDIQAEARSGFSASTAGDVNGDGFSDVIFGAHFFDAGQSDEGRAFLFYGGGGRGAPLRPRQLRADSSAPVSPTGWAYQQEFGLGLTLHSPMGVGARRPQWQVRPWGGTFSEDDPIQSGGVWYELRQEVVEPLTLTTDGQRYVWRARVQFSAAQSPFASFSRWVTIGDNGLYEADLYSTAQSQPPTCAVPREAIHVYTMSIDGDGKPVLHGTDTNPPSEITGYNVYRASTPTGPWVSIGANVPDLDPGTPNLQFEDPTGDVGSPWFYQVVAFNAACGAEGP